MKLKHTIDDTCVFSERTRVLSGLPSHLIINSVYYSDSHQSVGNGNDLKYIVAGPSHSYEQCEIMGANFRAFSDSVHQSGRPRTVTVVRFVLVFWFP